ncbi:hypothetical protein [Pseudomonas baetica]|uniref:hypothetical protein n=1 Tax=Pseudomonas baetica TaxID=674054 RepID=UPI002404D837|nr:hypothetical protein [Pseudomonas baetica]MDF9779002.1 hypothetical protein [Pseudomonas baetica]
MKFTPVVLATLFSANIVAAALPGTPEAARAYAVPYLVNRFVTVAKPEIHEDQAVVKTMVLGQECTLHMVQDPSDKSGTGWRLYGSICGAKTAAEQQQWYSRHGFGNEQTATSNYAEQ